ncbi:hypothetical protein PoB_006910000 [Plakobranchus ocellatus]|uniref:Uncharacterized protein n=1 Tax=Plakobranchus ocellatus TaxID=259542 RepID=A0AAV4DEQ8_9GAST|nr:hypothetical protein PoB_006910000 [Plakobranchus ocellatus]
MEEQDFQYLRPEITTSNKGSSATELKPCGESLRAKNAGFVGKAERERANLGRGHGIGLGHGWNGELLSLGFTPMWVEKD